MAKHGRHGRRHATIPQRGDYSPGPIPFGLKRPMIAKRQARKGGGVPKTVERSIDGAEVLRCMRENLSETVEYMSTLPWSEIEHILRRLPKKDRDILRREVEKECLLTY